MHTWAKTLRIWKTACVAGMTLAVGGKGLFAGKQRLKMQYFCGLCRGLLSCLPLVSRPYLVLNSGVMNEAAKMQGHLIEDVMWEKF